MVSRRFLNARLRSHISREISLKHLKAKPITDLSLVDLDYHPRTPGNPIIHTVLSFDLGQLVDLVWI